MSRKAILGATLVGAISLTVYIMALFMGVNYTELIGITIIQIAYILILAVYGTVMLIKKVKEEEALEKVPVKVESYTENDEYKNEY